MKLMFKKIFEKIIQKPVKLIYYASLKKIIANDLPVYDKNILIGENCCINPSAILTCVNNSTIIFEGDNYIGRNVEIGANKSKIFFGSHASIQDRCIILGDVEIGRYCVFAPNIYISSGRHNYNFKPELYIQDQDKLVQSNEVLSNKHSKKVVIEDDCWLGINVVVMSGVKICKGSVIGANSVVTKDVEPYSVMTGSPAKLIKKRFNFELKESINYIHDFDLPYFYSGFNTSLRDVIEDRKEGGISAKQNFTTYLKSEDFSKIILKIKVAESLKIEYNNQIRGISEAKDFIEIIFNIANIKLHTFKILSNKVINGKILIQSIRVQ